MTIRVVTDEQLGVLARRQNDLFCRVRKGTLPVERVLIALQGVIEGDFNAIPNGARRLINCDAAPFIPNGWSIYPEDQIKSAVCGQLEFDPAKVVFHLDDAQKTGVVVGNDLRKRLEGKPVLKANVLDYLYANTDLIPESWNVDEYDPIRYIFFWGTIYRDSYGSLCVRCLCLYGGEWDWRSDWLGHNWDVQRPAAVLASS